MSHVKHDVGEGGMDFMLITCRATNHREGRSEAEQRQRGGERRREAEREADARRERERGGQHHPRALANRLGRRGGRDPAGPLRGHTVSNKHPLPGQQVSLHSNAVDR